MALNISLRDGDSHFGNEVVFQLRQVGKSSSYNKRTKEKHAEFYLNKELGLFTLKTALKFFDQPEPKKEKVTDYF